MKVNKLTWVLKQKWFWMLFVILLATIIVPFLLVWIVLSLPPVYLVWALIVALAVWAVLKGYQDRAERKRDEGENRTT
jgi:Flp pilus assembly protein TadB